MSNNDSAERVVQDIRCKTRNHYSAEQKIQIMLLGLRAEENIATII